MVSSGIDRDDSGHHNPGLTVRVAHYVFPILLIAIIGALRIFLPYAITAEISLLLLTISVFLSARIGGIWPGLLGTLLGVALEVQLSPSAGATPRLIVFAATGVTLTLLTVPLRFAVRRAFDRQRQQTLDALPNFAAILARNGVVEEVNRAALDTASLNRVDVIGKPFHETYWWSHSGELQNRVQAALSRCREGEPVQLEATVRRGPDSFTPVQISFVLHNGFVMVSALDIGEQLTRQRENDELRERLEHSETILHQAHRAAGIAVFDWLVQDNVLAWSRELRAIFATDQTGDQPADWRTLIDPEDRDSVEREIRRLLNSGAREYKLEFRVTPKTGPTRWLLSAGAIQGLADKRQRLLGVIVDLTQVKQLEAAARDSENRYSLLTENLPDIVFTAQPDGRWDYVSPVWVRYTGALAADAIDYGWSSALHPEDMQSVLYRWMDAVQTSKLFASEHRMRGAGGAYRWFLMRSAPLQLPDEGVVKWFGAITDIDDQKRLESAIRTQEKWREQAQESAAAGSFEWEVQTGRLRCSDEWLRLNRIQPAPVLLKENWIGAIHADDRNQVRQELDRCCVESGRREFDYRIDLPDSPIRWVNTRVTAYVDDDGKPLRVIGFSFDVTERRELEDALRRKQRLESIGMLAGGIAHDFNNLLAAIMGNSSLLLERLLSVTPWIEDILGATQRATDLTRQMLAFAGRGRFQTQPVNLSELAREIAGSLGSAVRRNVQIQLELSPDLPAVDADPNQIGLVLTTLINNAAEAIGENAYGVISIATFIRQVGSESFDIASGSYVALEVRDTGCGMDEATKARVFDPFFTTKFHGRGLGLAAALGVVRGHKGAIEVSSVPGQGSTFTALFPASPDVPIGKPATATPLQLEASGKILVVDDEAVVRNLAKAVLERYGYSVVVAEDGEKALAQFTPNPRDFALVLLDFAMPGLSSDETLQRLKDLRPEVKVLLFSGYSAEDALRSFEGKGLAGFLQKPFTAQALAEKVNAVINAGQPDSSVRPKSHVLPPDDTAHPA